MSLSTRDYILTGQFSADGSPWVQVAAKSSIELDSLEFSVDGSPWWGVEFAAAVGGNVKKFIVVPFANVKKAIGVSRINIKRIIMIGA